MSNAHRFGKSFPFSEYVRLGAIGNDAAQVGLLDLGAARAAQATDLGGLIGQAFARQKYNWENRPALRAVRRAAPYVLFLGVTTAAT